MLGPKLAQAVKVGLAGTDFGKLAARLSLVVDTFEIERNGLGYNNLIYMAVVLSELAKNADAAFRGLIVEEPKPTFTRNFRQYCCAICPTSIPAPRMRSRSRYS